MSEHNQASSVVFIFNDDGTVRFLVDYWKVYSVTLNDSYHLNRMIECKDSSWNAQLFSALDASSRYLQIEVDKTDCEKTSFTAHYRLYQCIRIRLVLKNGPGTFQRVMYVILSVVKW